MSGPPRYWTRERIIVAIYDWTLAHGKPPTQTQWRAATPTTPCVQVVHYRFGKWADAIEAAGYPRPRRGRPRREAALQREAA